MNSSLIILVLCLSALPCGGEEAASPTPTPAKESKPVNDAKKNTTPVIEDKTFIKANPDVVFKALTDGKELAKWWPKDAETDPKAGGKITLTWFNGSKMESKFEKFEPGKEVSYPFYTEHLSFVLTAKGGGTELKIVHACGPDAAIHVAQAWGFLKANLKSVIETGHDLRD